MGPPFFCPFCGAWCFAGAPHAAAAPCSTRARAPGCRGASAMRCARRMLGAAPVPLGAMPAHLLQALCRSQLGTMDHVRRLWLHCSALFPPTPRPLHPAGLAIGLLRARAGAERQAVCEWAAAAGALHHGITQVRAEEADRPARRCEWTCTHHRGAARAEGWGGTVLRRGLAVPRPCGGGPPAWEVRPSWWGHAFVVKCGPPTCRSHLWQWGRWWGWGSRAWGGGQARCPIHPSRPCFPAALLLLLYRLPVPS